MKMIYPNAQELNNIFEIVDQFIEEGYLTVNENGLALKCGDRAMVCILDLSIKPNAFEQFTTEKEEKLGININSFLNVLKKAKKEDKITIGRNDSKLILTLWDYDLNRTFRIPLLDLTTEDLPQTDNLEFTGRTEVLTKVLEQIIKDSESISDFLVVEVNENLIFTTDNDVSDYKVELDNLNTNLLSLNGNGKSRYPIDYLKKLIDKDKKLFDSVVLNLANDYPLKIEHSLGDRVKFDFVLAPRVIE